MRLPFVLAATLALTCASAHASTLADFYGVGGDPLKGNPDAAANFATIASGGVQLVRAQAFARLPGQYYWFNEDLLEQNAAPAGVRWYPFIGWSPQDDMSTADPNTPPNVSDYAAFATALAQRYGPGGTFWQEHPEFPALPVKTYEVWNEENAVAFWHPQDDAPGRYADLYLATRKAIKAVDPNATVVVGGLALGQPGSATDEVDFLNRMFAHRPDLRGNVDAIALHPYQRNLSDVYARIARVREAIDRLAGPSVPIEITEIGWSRSSVPESERAADLRTLATDLPRSDCNIDRLIPFQWIDGYGGTFGIANSNGTPMPSGQAYLDAVRTMRGLSSTPAPTGVAKVCNPDPRTPAPGAPASGGKPGSRPYGPRLVLRVVVDRHHARVRVLARCPAGCALSVKLLAPHGRSGHLRRLALRHAAMSRRQRRFVLRLPPRARRLRVTVVATGHGGGVTSRTRQIKRR
ncbi:MAG TPA: hypothetical protein VJU60_10375 [Thermoleophilaceae bacterium]|nr:hypothetical protein [Thermoleophilaceae bacterium]